MLHRSFALVRQHSPVLSTSTSSCITPSLPYSCGAFPALFLSDGAAITAIVLSWFFSYFRTYFSFSFCCCQTPVPLSLLFLSSFHYALFFITPFFSFPPSNFLPCTFHFFTWKREGKEPRRKRKWRAQQISKNVSALSYAQLPSINYVFINLTSSGFRSRNLWHTSLTALTLFSFGF